MASEVSEAPRAGDDDADTAITLGVLDAVHADSAVTQRRLAGDLGIALGLTNAYLRRCVRKGLVKVSQAPPNRYLYYLTPKGFAEKSRLTGEYLSDSFSFFRRARNQCANLLHAAGARGWRRIVLYGASELAEIASLCEEPNVTIVAVVDPNHRAAAFGSLDVAGSFDKIGTVDAVLLTTLDNPQAAYGRVRKEFSTDQVLVPPLLRVTEDAPGDPSP